MPLLPRLGSRRAMTAPRSRRTAARGLAIGLIIAGMSGCARNGLATSGVSAQQDLQAALAAARTAESPRPEAQPAEPASRQSRISENLANGHREAEAGRLDQASRFYERVLREDPSNPVAHHRLAVIADQNRDFPTAERHYSAALVSRRDDPDLLNDLGYCYLLQGRYPESERTLRDAIAAAPAHERAITNLGLLYGTIGDVDRALAVLRTTGSEAEARTKLAMLLPRSGAAASMPTPVPSGVEAGAITPAGMSSPQSVPVAAPGSPPGQSDAMRDLMAQLDQAKRDALVTRGPEPSAPSRLPGLIDPGQTAPQAATSPSVPAHVVAQPYQRGDRFAHVAARPESRGADPSGAAYGTAMPAGRNPPAAAPPAIGASDDLPLWSPQGITTGPLGPGLQASPAFTQPRRDHVQYASAEVGPYGPATPRAGSPSGIGGSAAELPPPAFPHAAPSQVGYGHAAPSVHATAEPRSLYEEPGMRAYADDLARRDAEVAEMHRYMESLRRPETAEGERLLQGVPGGGTGYPGTSR